MRDSSPIIDSSLGRRIMPFQIPLCRDIALVPDRTESQPVTYSTQPFQHLIVFVLDRTHLQPERDEINFYRWIKSLRGIDHVLPDFVRFFERSYVVDVGTILSTGEGRDDDAIIDLVVFV